MPESIETDAKGITVREHLERLIKENAVQNAKDLAALRRELDLIQKFTAEAGLKADKIEEEWRKATNEWRGTVTDILTHYATAPEVKALEKSLLAADEADRNRAEAMHTLVTGRVSTLELKESALSGKMGGITAAIALILALVGLIMQFIKKP